jgi:hypothetical protein
MRGWSGESSIDFRSHQVRDRAGAPQDFEQMLTLLVRRQEGDAWHIHGAGGDWGIDVLAGDLNGQVRIWQAKYFPDGVKSDHKNEIEKSFDRSVKKADDEGYRIERWTLCVPSTMTVWVNKWWQGWRAEKLARYKNLTIDLWDGTRLTEMLLEDRMADIRRHFYGTGPVAADPTAGHLEPVRLRISADDRPSEAPANWRGGAELLVGDRAYLLHDPVEEATALDRSWTLWGATADEIQPTPRRVWLRQLHVRRDTGGSRAARSSLAAQGALLERLPAAPGLPRRVGALTTGPDGRLTLVTGAPVAPAWRAVHAVAVERTPVTITTDPMATAAMLGHAVGLARLLARLHRHGRAHGMVDGDGVLIVDRRRRVALRDLGCAGFGPVTSSAVTGVDLPTLRHAQAWDVARVAVLVRETLLGVVTADGNRPADGRMLLPPPPPPPPGPGPARGAVAPAGELMTLLARSTDPDPARRPTVSALADGLEAARRRLSLGEPA